MHYDWWRPGETLFLSHNTRAENSTNLKLRRGEGSFTCAAATEWNKLPLEMKEAQNAQTFKKKVKLLDTTSR